MAARRENAMELYVSHDIGSVSNHFYEPDESETPYREHLQFGKSNLFNF